MSINVRAVDNISSGQYKLLATLLLVVVALTLTAAPVSAEEPSISGDTAVEAVPGETVTAEYTVRNEGSASANALIEFENLSSNTSVDSVSGDIANDLLGSSPPGVITTSIASGNSATISVVYAVNDTASLGTTDSIQVRSSMQVGGATNTDSMTTQLSTPTAGVNVSSVKNKSVQNGSSFSLTYTIANEIPSSESTSVLLEAPSSTRPQTVSVESVNGDVSQDLTGSTPPGVITSPLAYNDSTTITVTYMVAETVPLNTTFDVGVSASTSSGTYSDGATTTLTITKDPLANRFGGSDGDIGNLDVLKAVDAANKGTKIGGDSVDNLDVLQLVQRANA